MPNYLTGDGSPGSRFHYDTPDGTVPAGDPDALPTKNPQHPTLQAPFVCIVSKSTAAGHEPAHLVEYGHGLLGDPHEVEAGNVRAFADEHNAVVCATAWAGMSEPDVPNAIAALNDISLFPTVVDRLQQGVLNQIFLGRLMTRSGGLSNLGQLRRADGTLMIDTSHLDYDGNSQGGIMGLMLAAVSPDIERAVLGVPGMNYSLLLPRSKDWATYESVLKPAYPNDLDRTFIVSLLQMLWDRGEGAGYAQHVTKNPYEGTKVKPILMHVAFGDAQVSELAAFVEARTLGVPIQKPLDRARAQQGGRTGVGDGRRRSTRPTARASSCGIPAPSRSRSPTWRRPGATRTKIRGPTRRRAGRRRSSSSTTRWSTCAPDSRAPLRRRGERRSARGCSLARHARHRVGDRLQPLRRDRLAAAFAGAVPAVGEPLQRALGRGGGRPRRLEQRAGAVAVLLVHARIGEQFLVLGRELGDLRPGVVDVVVEPALDLARAGRHVGVSGWCCGHLDLVSTSRPSGRLPLRLGCGRDHSHLPPVPPPESSP